jgi:hypothetical protein
MYYFETVLNFLNAANIRLGAQYTHRERIRMRAKRRRGLKHADGDIPKLRRSPEGMTLDDSSAVFCRLLQATSQTGGKTGRPVRTSPPSLFFISTDHLIFYRQYMAPELLRTH